MSPSNANAILGESLKHLAKSVGIIGRASCAVMVTGSLNDQRLLERIKAKQQEAVDCEIAHKRKKRREGLDRIEKVAAIRQKKGRGEENEFKNWDARQCSYYLQYKKVDTDGAMPKKIGPLRAKCKEVMGRASPTVSPHASDDECSVGGDDDDNDCETDLRGALSEQI